MRDSYCSQCGTKYEQTATYPRRCAKCRLEIWANPIPVAVTLVPVRAGERTGLLVVRRAIPPVGALALVGGFVEEHESWQSCAARELREEANVIVEPALLAPLWFASSEPKPNRLLVFSVAPVIDARALPDFEPNGEASERGVIFGGGTERLAFSLHEDAVARFGITGPWTYERA